MSIIAGGKTSSWQDTVSCEVSPLGIFVPQVAVVSEAVLFLLPPVSFPSLPITPVIVGRAIG